MIDIEKLKQENKRLKDAITKMAEMRANPAVMIMNEKEVEKKYHEQRAENKRFKKLIGNIYIKRKKL